MRFTSESQLDGLVTDRVMESPSLEFKSELHLDTREQKVEALKDLTGMANGGGGTVLFGVDEDKPGQWGEAKAVTPLRDAGLLSRLENVVRDSVHPPLLVGYSPIRLARGGFVLSVDVRRSPVGPYMVSAYKQHRYFRRVGSSSEPMSEQEVRDAYALATRATERRPLVWTEHGLPWQPPTNDLWLIVSALPEEPLSDMLDMRGVEPVDFMPPESMMTYINNMALGNLTPTLRALTRWADGFHGDDADPRSPFEHVMRVHRDGAALIATRLVGVDDTNEPVWTTRVFRVLNAALLYLGWMWDHFGLGSPVELRIELRNVLAFSFEGAGRVDQRQTILRVNGPAGANLDPIHTEGFVLPWEMLRATERHTTVLRFADRLHQALGEREVDAPFRHGMLYDSAGVCINMSVQPSGVFEETNMRRQVAWVYDDGSIGSFRTGQVIGWHLGGAIVDLDGNTIAVLELAPGAGCPDDFVGTTVSRDALGEGANFHNTPQAHAVPQEPPQPTQQWAAIDLRSFIDES